MLGCKVGISLGVKLFPPSPKLLVLIFSSQQGVLLGVFLFQRKILEVLQLLLIVALAGVIWKPKQGFLILRHPKYIQIDGHIDKSLHTCYINDHYTETYRKVEA